MCGGSGTLNLTAMAPSSCDETENLNRDMNSKCSFSCLLEFAADNDVEGFKQLTGDNSCTMGEIGVWYSHQKGLKHMVLEHRTSLMIAARYGSVDVVKLITSLPGIEVNQICEPEKSTALHCAASGGSSKAAEITKLLLLAEADPNAVDANGKRPFDVIAAHPKFPDLKVKLQELLRVDESIGQEDLQLSSSGSTCENVLSTSLDSALSHISGKSDDEPLSSAREKKDYLVYASFPDIKCSMYSTDEFRMYSFKIRPCSRAYSHDWTECPFVHPGENARRRDPRKFHYSCVPCPEFRKGSCKRGELCEYAHGVFESWLHPAQYRTRICKDGTSCDRRVCFFAHKNEELRPLYLSTGSGSPSPGSTNSMLSAMDMAAVLSMLPGSPSSVSSPFSPPMSPTGNGVLHSSMVRPLQSIPSLHLPGSNLQTSRLRSSLNARDLRAEHMNGFSPRNSVRLAPSNLEELFSTEMSSPRCYDKHAAFSPTHKSLLLNQMQQQNMNMLSPLKTTCLSPRNVEHLHVPVGLSSPHGMSPRRVGPLSPICGPRPSVHLPSNVASNLSWGSPNNHGARWESVGGNVDWSTQPEKPIQLPTSSSEVHRGELPDFSWVQSLVKESSPPIKTVPVEGSNFNSNPSSESNNKAMISAWLEQMQLDPIVS